MNRQARIQAILEARLTPTFLNVQNESGMHQVPEGSETHFKITVVSEKFSDKNRLEAHRLIHELLKAELQSGLHALSLHLFTPQTWQGQKLAATPACRGGYDGKEKPDAS